MIIDDRISDLESDDRSKLNHVKGMIIDVVDNKKIPVKKVLMDS